LTAKETKGDTNVKKTNKDSVTMTPEEIGQAITQYQENKGAAPAPLLRRFPQRTEIPHLLPIPPPLPILRLQHPQELISSSSSKTVAIAATPRAFPTTRNSRKL
jgi:hypothetical protein